MINVLSSIRPIMHQQQINVLLVVYQESFMARWHEMACPLVRTVTDLLPLVIVRSSRYSSSYCASRLLAPRKHRTGGRTEGMAA
jgi:hypothetical protein